MRLVLAPEARVRRRGQADVAAGRRATARPRRPRTCRPLPGAAPEGPGLRPSRSRRRALRLGHDRGGVRLPEDPRALAKRGDEPAVSGARSGRRALRSPPSRTATTSRWTRPGRCSSRCAAARSSASCTSPRAPPGTRRSAAGACTASRRASTRSRCTTPCTSSAASRCTGTTRSRPGPRATGASACRTGSRPGSTRAGDSARSSGCCRRLRAARGSGGRRGRRQDGRAAAGGPGRAVRAVRRPA